MAEIVADLHLHSDCSDGITSPADLLQRIENIGLKAFSLTDHDSVAGHEVMRGAGKVEFIPGIELTSTEGGKEIHILGYFISSDFPELLEIIGRIAVKRRERIKSIVDSLNRIAGLNIDMDELAESIGAGSYNRLNLARFIVQKGLAQSIDECFNRYLGESSESYETVNFFSPGEAIGLLHRAGGKAFLAHPFHTDVIRFIPKMVEQGLDGIEAYHPSQSPEETRSCLEMAAKYGLGVCGGSDYHGNENSKRKILASGLDDEMLQKFLTMNTASNCVSV
jgi:hypothetical protein